MAGLRLPICIAWKLPNQEDTVRNDLEFQQAIIEATGFQRTIRYFSELTGDVRRFNNLLAVVYTDRRGDAEKYVVSLFNALKTHNIELAENIWSAKFQKAMERYLSLIDSSSSDGASKSAMPTLSDVSIKM
jgi:hypothetical protein